MGALSHLAVRVVAVATAVLKHGKEMLGLCHGRRVRAMSDKTRLGAR